MLEHWCDVDRADSTPITTMGARTSTPRCTNTLPTHLLLLLLHYAMAFGAEKVAGMGAEALRRIILLCVALRKAHLVSETLTLLHC